MSEIAVMPQEKLRIVPCTIELAREYIATLHRHHTPDTTRTRWALAVADCNGNVRGVALVGYPVARYADDGWTIEVQRLATDGSANACSALYGAAARLARSLGYARIVTYIRHDEPGVSLRAAGWLRDSPVQGTLSWNRATRPRTDKTELVSRTRWSVAFAGNEPRDLVWLHRLEPDQLALEVTA